MSLQAGLMAVADRSDKKITLDKEKLQLEVELNVSTYGPEDVFVNQTGDWVVVNAQHTVRADKYGYITRQLTRQIYIPEGLDKDTISGRYTETGNLVLNLKALGEEGFKRAEKMYGDPKPTESAADPCSPCG